jgi:hypothetical protein
MGKTNGKRQLGIPGYRLEDNTKMDITDIGEACRSIVG